LSYRDLEIWQMARALTIDIHRMTLRELPKFEMYEEGSLFETESLANEALYKELRKRLNALGRKINNFLRAVEIGHRTKPPVK
jgi:hypothetical protein